MLEEQIATCDAVVLVYCSPRCWYSSCSVLIAICDYQHILVFLKDFRQWSKNLHCNKFQSSFLQRARMSRNC